MKAIKKILDKETGNSPKSIKVKVKVKNVDLERKTIDYTLL